MLVHGLPVGKESFAPFAPQGILVQKEIDGKRQWMPLGESDWPPVGEMTDGLISYGAKLTTQQPPASVYQDLNYVKELHRRAAILTEVYGMDFMIELNKVLPQKGQR